MQDFIKQSSAHKRHQCCAILDHINIFQSRIIFQQRDKTQKNMSSRYQHKILNHPRRGVGVCYPHGQVRGCEQGKILAMYQQSHEHRYPWPFVCVLRRRGGLAWLLAVQSRAFLHSRVKRCGNMTGVFSLAESSKGDMSSTWINKYK